MARPLASRVPPLTTYLLRQEGEPSQVLVRFIERVESIESPRSEPSSGSHGVKIVPFLLVATLITFGQPEAPQKANGPETNIQTRTPIRQHSLHREAGRGGHRAFGWKQGGLL